MAKLKSSRSPERLIRLSDERDKLQTEFVQIHSMLLSIEEHIVEEILRQVTDSPPHGVSNADDALRGGDND